MAGKTQPLITELKGADAGRCLAALDELPALPAERFDWELVMALACCLEASPPVAEKAEQVITQLKARGVGLRAVFQRAVAILRRGEEDAQRRAARVLDPAAAWASVDLEAYIGDFVQLLLGDATTVPLAIDLLDLAAAQHPAQVSTSLYIRSSKLPEALIARLRTRLDARDPEIMKRAVRAQPEQTPVAIDALVRGVQGSRGPFLLAEGQYSPDPAKSVRITIVCAGKSVADAWVAPGDRPALATALATLGPVRAAECDTMYATGMVRAWTIDGAPFELWDEDGRRLWQDASGLHTRSAEITPSEEIVNVEAYLEEGWVVRGVRCNLKSGGRVAVAEERDAISTVDPTYDGLNLMCDAAWAVSLARALGAALKVPTIRDEAL